jgi:hypothetical protein
VSDEQKNDFWSSSSNDDFWNKPVGDDWLKKDEPKPETNEPSWNENPYYQSHVHEDEVKGSVFHEENTDSTYWDKAADNVYREQKSDNIYTGEVPEQQKKRVHVHTIICLISICIMVFVILAVAAAASLTKNVQKKEARVVSYTEENLTSPVFDYYDNNTVTLENNCYTIVNHDIYAGFPEDYSLIAIRVDVESSAYVQNAYVMKNCYIGYEENGTVEYKQSLGRDVYYPYVAGYGFDSSSFLSDYGCGNGADITGYFFFLIPADVQEITLYMEKYDLQHDTIDKIETVMSWNMGVLPYDEEIPGRLAKEGGYHYE